MVRTPLPSGTGTYVLTSLGEIREGDATDGDGGGIMSGVRGGLHRHRENG